MIGYLHDWPFFPLISSAKTVATSSAVVENEKIGRDIVTIERKRVFGDLEAKLNSNIPTSFWMNKMDE